MKNISIISFILENLKPFKFLIMGQLFVGTIWAIDMSLRPYIIKMMLDKIPHLRADNIVNELSTLVAFYLSMSLLIVILFRLYDYIWLKLNPPLKCHMGGVLMNRMMEHSVGLFQDQFAGSLANKIKEVMSGIPDLLRLIINQFYSHLLAFIIATFTVFTVNYKFSLLLAIWIVIFIMGSLFFAKRAKILCNNAAEVRSKFMGQIVDILGNITSVSLFTAKRNESNKLKIRLDEYIKADQQRDWWFLIMFTFQGISFVIYQAICFIMLISGFKEGFVTAGDFALLITINISIVDSLWSFSTDIMNLSEISGNITQGLKIVLTPIEIYQNPDAKTLQIKDGTIVFDKVRFHYKGTDPLFHNKSVIIKAGQKVGLVGYSGSGKTTFVNLILRLYDIRDGAIIIDGQDIRDVTLDSLREHIGMIPQDPSLFHRSLLENIRYGRVEAIDEEVIEAAKRAHAHEFITKLPQGYDSLVGERGVKLSGGQRQRIAIARAILKNAPILILDEATSQLDSLTEQEIQASLWGLMQDKTTIVIAHRLSTLLHMDRILVFEHGKIIEDGSHAELLSRGGLYKTLWNAQVGGFLPSKKEVDNE